MLELQNNHMKFSFPEVHPAASMSLDFHRTLRIPDDDKAYALPPSLGLFPVRHVEDFESRLPDEWKKRGGVMLPMYQSEALWIAFGTTGRDPERGQHYPFAIKIAAGKRSALTGKDWSKKLREKDYCVIPGQPWIDGFVLEDGFIRQFIAMPLGMGFTAEEQITGKAEFGGIQLEVIPMKRSAFERRFPVLPPSRPHDRRRLGGVLRSASMGDTMKCGGAMPAAAGARRSNLISESAIYSNDLEREIGEGPAAASVQSMGLGAGGRMKQDILADPFSIEDWDLDHKSRCFVHLANSMTWRAITNEDPPTVPFTAAEYTRRGLPWFEHYADGPTLKGTDKLKGLKTVREVGAIKGIAALPENQSTTPKNVLLVGSAKQVKDGVWK